MSERVSGEVAGTWGPDERYAYLQLSPETIAERWRHEDEIREANGLDKLPREEGGIEDNTTQAEVSRSLGDVALDAAHDKPSV